MSQRCHFSHGEMTRFNYSDVVSSFTTFYLFLNIQGEQAAPSVSICVELMYLIIKSFTRTQ